MKKNYKSYGGHFDIDNKKNKIKELEEQTKDTNFWNDRLNAEKVIKELNDEKNMVNSVEQLLTKVTDNLELINLLGMEIDEESRQELEQETELIKQKTVAIIGIGGVGTYSLETIIRSGIENIIIVDYDTFDITNINRQLYATTNTIGKKKIEVAKKRALEINPKINIITIDKKLDNSNIEELFNYKIDYIIDACDDIN